MLSAGQTIGDYQLIDMLGAGGFGAVWRARDRRRDDPVALKVLHDRFCTMRSHHGGPSVADRFLEEARIVQALDHPGVVRIGELIDDRADGVIAYSMELLEGSDLGAAVDRLELPDVLEAYATIAEILGYVHARGVIHRDVKETNIFVGPNVTRTNGVKLLDFGVAKNVAAESAIESTATGMFIGTIQSMAPECLARFNGEAVELTGAVDQWALGVSLFRTLTGFAPFQSPAVLQLMLDIQRSPPPPLTLRARFDGWGLEAQLSAVVNRCLSKAVAERFATMDQLAASLRSLCDRLAEGQSTQRTPAVHLAAVDTDATLAEVPDRTDPDPTMIDAPEDAETIIPGNLDARVKAARAAGRLPLPEVVSTDPDPTEMPHGSDDLADPESDPTLVRVDGPESTAVDPTMRDLPPAASARPGLPDAGVRVSGISDPAEIRRRSVVKVRRSVPKGAATPRPTPPAMRAPVTRPTPAPMQTFERPAVEPAPKAALVVMVVALVVIAFCLGWFLRVLL